MQTTPETFSLKGAKAPDLIFGLDPLNADHAALIVTDCGNHTPLKRALAWRALKAARGRGTRKSRVIAQTLGLPRTCEPSHPA